MIGQSSLFQSNPKITNFWHMGSIVILWHLFFFYLLCATDMWVQLLFMGSTCQYGFGGRVPLTSGASGQRDALVTEADRWGPPVR